MNEGKKQHVNDPKVTGTLDPQYLSDLGYMPDGSRLARGPVAIYECVEPIPCNVCVFSCPFHAVTMENITDIPKIDFAKCNGCSVCVGKCPGQAIFVIDLSKPGEFGTVTLQYDLMNPPKKGDEVVVLNREGRKLGYGEVTLVYKEKTTGSYVISVKVPKNLVMEVRVIRPGGETIA